jgi:DNA (cytosine-5)-methyltransferase 1
MAAIYYNEFDPFAAAWLRKLIEHGHLPGGDVDERSIRDVSQDDLKGYTQVHFFAGIGGWPLALRMAGWPDDREVWTGSCPCQPFSNAGKHRGVSDERHLWPVFRSLIGERRPATVFGEQVASRLGREWLAGVRADLENLGYAVGAADLCAASVGAPHIRQRLWWVGHANRTGLKGRGVVIGEYADKRASGQTGEFVWVADTTSEHRRGGDGWQNVARAGSRSGMDNADRERRDGEPIRIRERQPQQTSPETPWSGAVGVPCSDGKTRRIDAEPSLFPLAARIPNRVGALRGAGNAICPQVAAEFIQAMMGCTA